MLKAQHLLLALLMVMINLTSDGLSQTCGISNSTEFSREVFDKIEPQFLKERLSTAKPTTDKLIRFIYLTPSDRSRRADYDEAIADAALHLQDFFQKELGSNYAYKLHDPIVEWYQTNQTASWYQTNPNGLSPNGYFYNNSVDEGFTRSGGSFNDPNNMWVYFIDAEPNCCNYAGGANHVALLTGADLRGLTGQEDIVQCFNPPSPTPTPPGCPNGGPDFDKKGRFIGGVGHELGHAFNLGHPWDIYNCTTLNCILSLMGAGYRNYPNTYFISQDESYLLDNYADFFIATDLRQPRVLDFDNDRISDFSIWRSSTANWQILKSSTSTGYYYTYGSSSDTLVPGDYDGDRKTDIAVWRPGNQTWYVFKSSDGAYIQEQFGSSGDKPVPADYDGDRITDFAVWRPGTTAYWWIRKSASSSLEVFQFGTTSDKPVPADYNGDKRTDIAVFRPSNTSWYVYHPYESYYYATTPPSSGYVYFTTTSFGLASDMLVPSDFDGDRKADLAIYRPSTGYWWLSQTTSGSATVQQSGWTSGDLPAPGDYDNDGKSDIAVWRPSDGKFYVTRSSNGSLYSQTWGISTDTRVASSFVF